MRRVRACYVAIVAASIAALPLTSLAAALPVSEREKFEADQAYRNRQLALAAADQELRRAEQSQSRWTNPLVLAIAAAAIAALGNAVVAYVNGRQQRVLERQRAGANRVLERYKSKAELKLESDKAKAQIDLEDRKAESDRILEVVRTGGSTEAAAANLQFLLDAGLVTQPRLDQHLRAFLATRAPGTGPTLPAADGRFRFEAVAEMPPEMTEMSRSLQEFSAYLERVGFARPSSEASIAFEDIDTTYYLPDTKRIVIGKAYRHEPDAAFRAYMHHILSEESKSTKSHIRADSSIQSGLADYFPCSFLGRPTLGERAAKELKLEQPYLRWLTTSAGYADLGEDYMDQWFKNGQIWGSLFWSIREGIGRDASDKLMLWAWTRTKWPRDIRKAAPVFLGTLVSIARADPPGDVSGAVLARLQERGFPVPK